MYCKSYDTTDNLEYYKSGRIHKILKHDDLLSCWNLYFKQFFCDCCEKIRTVTDTPCYIYYDKTNNDKHWLKNYLIKHEKYYEEKFYHEPPLKYYCLECLDNILNRKEIELITEKKSWWNNLEKFDASIIKKIMKSNKRFRCNKCGDVNKASQLHIDELLNLCDKCCEYS
jgi:hypothetical protein